MTGYQSKKAAASAKTIDEVNWADHEPDGRRAAAQDKLDSMEREALKLALEALEAAEIDGNCEYGATEIIRKALAQPEPVDDYTTSNIAARNILDAQPVPDFSYIKTYETKSPKN